MSHSEPSRKPLAAMRGAAAKNFSSAVMSGRCFNLAQCHVTLLHLTDRPAASLVSTAPKHQA